MHDDMSTALSSVQEVVRNATPHLAAKTAKMNHVLNYLIPYFRCSDPDIVKIYYYLWALYLMYFTHGDMGMQVMPHTQTAVNNFLGGVGAV